jgi:hypothetical protein
MQIEYAISINIEINADGQKITNGYISCETLPPLGYLSTNSLAASQDVIAKLKAHLNNPDADSFRWGADFCIITTKGNSSIVEYNDMSVENWRETIINSHMPTATLLQLMQDWAAVLIAVGK